MSLYWLEIIIIFKLRKRIITVVIVMSGHIDTIDKERKASHHTKESFYFIFLILYLMLE